MSNSPFILLIYTILIVTSCNSFNKKTQQVSITFSHSTITHGTPLTAIISNKEKAFDSLTFLIDNKTFSFQYTPTNTYQIPTQFATLGQKDIITTVYYSTETEIKTNTITIVSDITPRYPTYTILNSYNHAIDAYTQGLEFTGDSLYESTGIKGESSLRLINYKKGSILKKIDLQPEYFGEGITILHDIIYQITWQSQTGFIYDKYSFRQIGTFNYNTEGWGLCNDGTNLIMSDGSEFLYFYNPETFTLVKKLAVYDNAAPVKQLNELEYVNGFIYANIYTTNFIVKIDASNGKVIERINLSNILDKAYMHENIDVLNGIAWHAKNKSLFVTGKRWPILFEIQIVDSTSASKTL
ncbi:MAG TPA: glutaminyl-peptide cyclotransferase [Bacteroidales bacterium]|jgi:glutamine cyclotransferase|nr:glutaminyl-peptide cyclotransferase [Bacteroidales bacterium]